MEADAKSLGALLRSVDVLRTRRLAAFLISEPDSLEVGANDRAIWLSVEFLQRRGLLNVLGFAISLLSSKSLQVSDARR